MTARGVEGGQTRVDVQTSSAGTITVLLARDSTVNPATAPERVAILGEVPNVAIVLTDTYASQEGGMSYCQAGEEQFLRVVTLAGGKAGEIQTVKIASCRANLELADAGVSWDGPERTVRIHWLSGPGGAPEDRELAIGADGRVQRRP